MKTNSLTTDGCSLDRMMTEFFRSEQPRSWPAARSIVERQVLALSPAEASQESAAASRMLSRSKISLAIAAAVLLGGFSLLSEKSGSIGVPQPGVDLNGGSAKTPPELRSKPDRPAESLPLMP